MSQSTQRTLLIIGSILIIAIGAVLILSAVGAPSAGAPVAPRSANPARSVTPTTVTGDIPYPEITRVRLGDAKAALDLKQAVFLDVRDADSYANSHIPSAISIPLAELENRLSELDPNKWIITYCT